jgi:hypothetical protein
VEAVIYRNIKGVIEAIDLNWWKSYANQLELNLTEHVTKNTNTLTFYLNEESASFTIYRSGSTHELCLDYLRLEYENNSQMVKLIDSLIYDMRLSGEKHIISAGPLCESTYFKKGKAINSDHADSSTSFELHLMKEAIFGHVHLALDDLINAQRSGDREKEEKIKKIFNLYQKQLAELNEQIHQEDIWLNPTKLKEDKN